MLRYFHQNQLQFQLNVLHSHFCQAQLQMANLISIALGLALFITSPPTHRSTCPITPPPQTKQYENKENKLLQIKMVSTQVSSARVSLAQLSPRSKRRACAVLEGCNQNNVATIKGIPFSELVSTLISAPLWTQIKKQGSH